MPSADRNRPLLQRAGGIALARLGQPDAAHAELVAALGSARARRAGYDVAATIDALDALGGADAEARRERDEIIDALKIVRLPHVPAPLGRESTETAWELGGTPPSGRPTDRPIRLAAAPRIA